MKKIGSIKKNMSDCEYSDCEDSYHEVEDIDDEDFIGQEKDELLNEGIDNSAKEKTDNKDEEDEEFDTEIDLEQPLANTKSRFVSHLKKITQSEYIRLISEIAEQLSDSRLFVPKKYEELFECHTGDCVLIAKNWVDNRRVSKLPVKLIRNALNKIPEALNPSNLVAPNELGFNDLGW